MSSDGALATLGRMVDAKAESGNAAMRSGLMGVVIRLGHCSDFT